jgi:hypothetical protein
MVVNYYCKLPVILATECLPLTDSVGACIINFFTALVFRFNSKIQSLSMANTLTLV